MCQCNHAQELEKALMAYSELQETNAQTREYLEAVLTEGDRNISKLQQEKHELESKLSQQLNMAESYQEYIEGLQRDLTIKDSAMKGLESELSAKHKILLSKLEGELEKARIVETELLDKNEQLEQLVEKLKTQLRAKELERTQQESFSGDSSEELEALQKEHAEMLKENIALQHEIEDLKKQCSTWKSQSSLKDSEISKLSCESTTYFNENERLKDKIKDLQAQLEVVTMQSYQRQAKGNSLFAEVEDRRVEVEKQLIDIRMENNTLKKQLLLVKEELNRAKMQGCIKWDVISSREYKSRLDSLNIEKKELTEENRALHFKLKAYIEEERRLKSLLEQSETSQDPNSRMYQILYKSNENKLRETTRELDLKTVALHMTENMLKKAESQLHDTKQELYSVISEKDKLQIKLDEMVAKYEPATQEIQKPKKVEYHTEKLNFSSRRKFQLSSSSLLSAQVTESTIHEDSKSHVPVVAQPPIPPHKTDPQTKEDKPAPQKISNQDHHILSFKNDNVKEQSKCESDGTSITGKMGSTAVKCQPRKLSLIPQPTPGIGKENLPDRCSVITTSVSSSAAAAVTNAIAKSEERIDADTATPNHNQKPDGGQFDPEKNREACKVQ